jgi:hypothetical protein
MWTKEEGTEEMRKIEIEQQCNATIRKTVILLSCILGKGWFCHAPHCFVIGCKVHSGHKVAGPFSTKTKATQEARKILKSKKDKVF